METLGGNVDFILGAGVPRRRVSWEPCVLSGDLAEMGSGEGVQGLEEVKTEARKLGRKRAA